MTFLTHIRFRLTAISPIHIGNGEEIDWTTSIADGERLYLLNLQDMNLSPKILGEIKQVSLNCHDVKGLLALQQIYKREKTQLIKKAVAEIALPPGLAQEFVAKLGTNVQKNQSGNKVINSLSISRTAHGGKAQIACIPGSSLKGAIRTAWLAPLAKRHHKVRGRKGSELDEKAVLGGSFATDPFRLLKIDDSLSSQKNATQVFYLTNPKRNPEKEKNRRAEGPPMRLEAITPFAHGEFSGAIRFNDLQGHKVKEQQVHAPAIMKLITAVNDFNFALFKEQAAQLEKLPAVDKEWLKATRSLINEMDRTNCMLVRLGRLGTAESKTVGHDLQEIFIPQLKKSLKHGTTFWLAGDYNSPKNLLPMGWAVIEVGNSPSKILEDYCRAMQPEAPIVIPNTPTEAIAWIEKMLKELPGDNKEPLAPIVLNILTQAKGWPANNRYDLGDILMCHNFGKEQQAIGYILDDICQ